MTEEEIVEFLENNGYPEHIVRGGSDGLLRRWREFAAEVEAGYPYGLHDYRHDLDIRGVIGLLSLDAQVAEADERLKAMLIAPEIRVWESVEGDPWWDFGIPKNAGARLRRDLARAGLFE